MICLSAYKGFYSVCCNGINYLLQVLLEMLHRKIFLNREKVCSTSTLVIGEYFNFGKIEESRRLFSVKDTN